MSAFVLAKAIRSSSHFGHNTYVHNVEVHEHPASLPTTFLLLTEYSIVADRPHFRPIAWYQFLTTYCLRVHARYRRPAIANCWSCVQRALLETSSLGEDIRLVDSVLWRFATM